MKDNEGKTMNAEEMTKQYLLRRNAELAHIKMVTDEFRAGFMVNTYGDNSGYVAVTTEDDPETGAVRMELLPYNYKQPRGSVFLDREQARALAEELLRFADSE